MNFEKFILQYCEQEEVEEGKLGDLMTSVVMGTYSVPQIIQELGPHLTHESEVRRRKAIAFLSEVVRECVVRGLELSQNAIDSLSTFFIARLDDGPCIPQVLRGIVSLQQLLGDRAQAEMSWTVLKKSNTQALRQKSREDIYGIACRGLAWETPEEALEFTNSLVSAIDGEKDPRNLVICFNLLSTVLESTAGLLGPSLEDAFDVFACYFPITFETMSDDPFEVSSDELVQGLRRCFASHEALSSHSLPFLLDKAISPQNRSEVFDTLTLCCSKFSISHLLPFYPEICDLLIRTLLHGESEGKAAAELLGVIGLLMNSGDGWVELGQQIMENACNALKHSSQRERGLNTLRQLICCNWIARKCIEKYWTDLKDLDRPFEILSLLLENFQESVPMEREIYDLMMEEFELSNEEDCVYAVSLAVERFGRKRGLLDLLIERGNGVSIKALVKIGKKYPDLVYPMLSSTILPLIVQAPLSQNEEITISLASSEDSFLSQSIWNKLVSCINSSSEQDESIALFMKILHTSTPTSKAFVQLMEELESLPLTKSYHLALLASSKSDTTTQEYFISKYIRSSLALPILGSLRPETLNTLDSPFSIEILLQRCDENSPMSISTWSSIVNKINDIQFISKCIEISLQKSIEWQLMVFKALVMRGYGDINTLFKRIAVNGIGSHASILLENNEFCLTKECHCKISFLYAQRVVSCVFPILEDVSDQSGILALMSNAPSSLIEEMASRLAPIAVSAVQSGDSDALHCLAILLSSSPSAFSSDQVNRLYRDLITCIQSQHKTITRFDALQNLYSLSTFSSKVPDDLRAVLRGCLSDRKRVVRSMARKCMSAFKLY